MLLSKKNLSVEFDLKIRIIIGCPILIVGPQSVSTALYGIHVKELFGDEFWVSFHHLILDT